jgi:hypothetical protein
VTLAKAVSLEDWQEGEGAGVRGGNELSVWVPHSKVPSAGQFTVIIYRPGSRLCRENPQWE